MNSNPEVSSSPLSDLPARPLLHRYGGLSGHQPKICGRGPEVA
jgi:hypothetical protein